MALKKIGTIVNAYGLKGQLKISTTTSNPEERFKAGNKILIIGLSGKNEEYTITSSIEKNSRITVISLDGFDDINQIQWMINKDVSQDVILDDDEYFFDDLIDMEVYSDKEEKIGKVTGVTEMPASVYLVINDNIYVPFLFERFISKVARDEKKIFLTSLGTETTK